MQKVLAAALLAANALAATFTGVVTDEHCGAKHAAATEADQDCVRKCIRGGTAPALIVGDKVYRIQNQDRIKDHPGQKVTVTGELNGNTLHIDSIAK